MIEPPIPLLWAKLRPPRLRADTVVRAELLDRLHQEAAALTAVVAPAGYGKTTVAVQLAGRRGGDVAWLSLEPADDDPVRFLTYVAAALCSAGVEGADETYEVLSAGTDGIAPASLCLRSAIEAHGRPVTLVLDDLHSLSTETLEATVGDWFRHPIANLCVVAAGRRDLALPVGRLRSHGRLTEARIEDLAFDGAEAAALLSGSFGLTDLTDEQLEALGARTEGWPVGLYLAGLALRDEPDVAAGLARFTGDGHHLSEYLKAEAVAGLSDHARAFVLATSILSVLDPALCDAVTDDIGSLRTLRQLVTDNVFTSALDENATVFRYHPMFQEHLRSLLEEHHPELVGELHAKASAWHETVGDIDRAIDHATAAGDIARAEHLIFGRFIPYVNAGHFGTVRAWVDALGPRRRRQGQTAVMMGWLSLNLRRYDELEEWLEIASANADGRRAEAMVAVHRASILAHRARHLGDVGALLAHGEDAVGAATDWREGAGPPLEDAIRGAALSVAACAAYWAGDHDLVRRRLAESLALVRSGGVTIELVFGHQYLAMSAADTGDHDAALAHADQALLHSPPSLERIYQPTLAHLARSIALSALGKPVDAAEALAAARRVAQFRPEPLYDAAIEMHQARLDHLTGDQAAARSAVRTARRIVARLPDARLDERLRSTENAIRFVARQAADLPAGARELTDREHAVLRLLPHRLSRRELARQLHVSENTVKTHLTSIRHKLGVTGRDSIVARAVELGLLPDLR